jgi:hypothetical protein
MRVVINSRILPTVIGYSAMLRELGHEPVALMCSRELADRHGGLGDLLAAAPADLDVVIPASRDPIAPLLHSLEPDLALCTGSAAPHGALTELDGETVRVLAVSSSRRTAAS